MQFLFLVVLLVILPDIYIWSIFVRGNQYLWSVLYWFPTVAIFGMMALGMAGYYQDWLMRLFFILVLCVSVPKFLFSVISLAGKSIGFFWPYAGNIGNAAGIAVAVLVTGAFIYGFTAGWKRITVKESHLVSKDLPLTFQDYAIVHLSDFHIGTYNSSPETVEKIVNQVNAINPDVIVFTGDLVNSSPDELDLFMETLSRLRAKDGIFSILGNHDYCEYHHYDTPDGASKNLEELKKREKELGWQLLLNEHQIICRGTDSIAIIGVENDGAPPFLSLADLPRATDGLSKDMFKILLSHDPSHWRRAVLPETDVQLTLSGHTHAMQLKIGCFSPSMWTYPEWGGLYTEQERMLYVSTGTGSNVAFRFGAWPEINLIRLSNK